MIDFERKEGNSSISLVVTPCSARKRKLPIANLCADKLPRGPQATVAKAWLARLSKAPEKLLSPAQEMYVGRAYQRIRTVSESTGARLLVISAGLGLVEGGTAIPSYDLTLSLAANQSLQTRISSPLAPSLWWEAVQRGPFATPIETLGQGTGRVLIALTHSYADMVGASLAALPPSVRGRLRIFGSGLSSHLPSKLHSQIVAYDGRLERLVPGTRLDAASRAMAHFVDLVGNVRVTTIDSDRCAVDEALSDIALPAIPSRKRVTNATLTRYITRFARSGLSATTALKRLRSEANIACEEGRFRRLYEEVRP